VEAIKDCDEALALDPHFIKVMTRKGRALLKLGQISEASDVFCFVLGWQPTEPETSKEEGDRYGKDLARQAMKQVVFAKTLRDRLVGGSSLTSKLMLQTAEELLSLCPYLRLVCSLSIILPVLWGSLSLGSELQSSSPLSDEEVVRGQELHGAVYLFDSRVDACVPRPPCG
jgi:hypothetical protein